MKNILSHTVFLLPLLLLWGCGREDAVEEPPRERHELVMRFFESMQKNAPSDAIHQGRTLIKLDTANQYLWELVYVQEYNRSILEAQKAVNAGDFKGAEAALERGVQAVPVNRALLSERATVRRLAEIQKAFNAMEKAVTAAAMEKAYAHALLVVGSEPGGKTKLYFAAYRQKIEQRKKLEAQWQAEAEAKKQKEMAAKAKTAVKPNSVKEPSAR